MTPDEFWTSQDGQILSVRPQGDNEPVALTLAFWPRHPSELEFMTAHLADLKFTERSTLARIGIDMLTQGEPSLDGNRIVIEAEAFLYDPSFPHADYWRKLLRLGSPVGRLFRAPATAKLTTEEIWEQVRANTLKLPNTISIDREGRVFLTPHHVRYTLKPDLDRPAFERLVAGHAGRTFLDKVQVRHAASPLTIPPRSGVLTSCSMYLKEHYVVLNQGAGNFGIHTSAVLLDPIKTFGTNIMLEIYNQGDQPVVNPMVSVEIFRAPEIDGTHRKALTEKRARLSKGARDVYECLDARPPQPNGNHAPKPRLRVTVKGQHATMANASHFVHAGPNGASLSKAIAAAGDSCGHATLIQALEHAPANADTLITSYFPNLLEQVELLARLPELKLRRIVFRHASRTHGFFLSHNAHGRLDTLDALGIDVYWYEPRLGDLYQHTYKKNHGFFLKEELGRRFQESTILAFYGSAVGLSDEQSARITRLIDTLTGYMGPNVGVITGGGGGVMGLACEQARSKGALTGACFLELEAQPPELGVDFFNTFQESSRHFRQKWFEVADFCIFNVGGVGTLEEIGIELCNLKLGIRPRVPFVFFDARYFRDLRKQLTAMIRAGRAPAWMQEYILFTDDPDEVVAFYREKLQVL
ncbi:LOG family protein [Synoicihabitans lomoniglobus]|uniref:AMP nucleosidase n=1 Tax=Synoicihabitans lomoniglobus TaxID=2909285 RepID=A0AAF0CSQ6_9BACT|nr:LOG family protein [Opitutaceae bacterium LMO-M01]WED67433.1 LOG family protein [Opitutaceae bacterium LMO-M01]